MTEDDFSKPVTSLLDRRNANNPNAGSSLLTPIAPSVLARADQALDRISRLSAALEKTADEMEKQLVSLKSRL